MLDNISEARYLVALKKIEKNESIMSAYRDITNGDFSNIIYDTFRCISKIVSEANNAKIQSYLSYLKDAFPDRIKDFSKELLIYNSNCIGMIGKNIIIKQAEEWLEKYGEDKEIITLEITCLTRESDIDIDKLDVLLKRLDKISGDLT